MKVIDTGRPYRVADAAEEDGAGEVVVGVGPVVGIGPGERERDKKYTLNLPKRTRYRIG